LNTDYEIYLWEKFLSGEDKAFARLYEVYSDFLWRYGTRLTTDHDLLKDCIQDMFVALYEKRKSLPKVDNVRFYMICLLRNKIIDAYRRNKWDVSMTPEEMDFELHYSYMPDNEDEDGFDEETYQRLDSSLQLLQPRQKEALYLRYKLNLSTEEVATALKINPQSARNLLHRTISRLRAAMGLANQHT